MCKGQRRWQHPMEQRTSATARHPTIALSASPPLRIVGYPPSLSPSAVQSAMGHPWSLVEKGHPPLEMVRKYCWRRGTSSLICGLNEEVDGEG